MLTLLRCSSLFAFAAVAAAQGDPDAGLVKQFGAPRSTGSYRAQFARAGGGMEFLQATDHYATLAAARKSSHDGGDWLLLAHNGDDLALRLACITPDAFADDLTLAPWTIEEGKDAQGRDEVKFTLAANGFVLERVLRHDPAQRGFVLEIALRNESSTRTGALDFSLGGVALVLPQETSLFGTVAVAIAVPKEGAAQHFAANGLKPFTVDPHQLSFAGTTNRFFGAFVWPRDAAAAAALTSLAADPVPAFDTPFTKAHAVARMRYGLQLAVPAAHAETRVSFGLYFGPKAYSVFATLPEPERFAPILDVDLNTPCCFVEMPGGRPMAKVLLWLLSKFHGFVGNWGVAIIMLTVLVRGLLAPVNFHMQKSMRAYGKRMAVVKPKLDALKTKYGDDKAAYQQAMLALQREHKLMPPLGGCLPIFLTMPIYLGLFTALRTAYDLRQQPFLAWIQDLSVPDALSSLPFFPHVLNLLPLVWLTLMLVQLLRQPLPTDPQQRQQMQIMRYMPLVFGVMLYNYAAALLVYMVTSILWTFVESSITKKILGPIDPNVASLAPAPM
jgi:YidC/Oxa1 family membrane protein insertase